MIDMAESMGKIGRMYGLILEKIEDYYKGGKSDYSTLPAGSYGINRDGIYLIESECNDIYLAEVSKDI
jgi:hypothetical protein